MSLFRRALRESAEIVLASLPVPNRCSHVSAKYGAPKHYVVDLPPGYPASQARIRLSVPKIRSVRSLHFSEHVMDGSERAGDTLLATMHGGFAVSQDLGKRWKIVNLRGPLQSLHLKWIGGGELLAQVQPAQRAISPGLVDVAVVDLDGNVLTKSPRLSQRWHGCRSVDYADGTLMYAEYPANGRGAERIPSRVFRSRDRGRSWKVVFERSGAEIRHFHFLQARPNHTGEWWLTSGDAPRESHVWVTHDDGDTWDDVSEQLPEQLFFGGRAYKRDLFRLTDLAWEGDAIVWGTDDAFLTGERAPGATVFRSPAGSILAPEFLGRGKWEFRNMIDVGNFWIFVTQGGNQPNAPREDRMPGVFLMPKSSVESALPLVHLFDIDVYAMTTTGFTYSRASRTAKDGTFFTYRRSTDVFPSGHNLLRWDVEFV